MPETPDDNVQPDPERDLDAEFDEVVRFLDSHDRCSAHKVNGDPCRQPVTAPGVSVCRFHGGAAPQVQEAAINRLRMLRDTSMERLMEVLEAHGSNLDPRVLLDVVTKLTDKIELLEGRATARTESNELRVEEVRKSFEVKLSALAESYKRAPAVLEMVDQMMEAEMPALEPPEEATG